MSEIGFRAWTNLGRRTGGTLVMPLGSTEQHGPHLPLNTDTEIARAVAAALAGRRPHLAIAPPLPYGASGEHSGFPGTLSIGTEATESVLVELGRSATETFQRLLFVSTHGGNREAVDLAVRRLRDEGREARAWEPSWPGDAHAGWTETSLMLAIAPDSVRMPAAVRGATAPIDELMPRLRSEGVRGVSPSGVIGDPAGANAEAGRTMLAEAAEELTRLLDLWEACG
jgi:creatinine amidohydrolase